MIKSGQFRNKDTTSKKVSGGSKNLEILKNTIKEIKSSLLITSLSWLLCLNVFKIFSVSVILTFFDIFELGNA